MNGTSKKRVMFAIPCDMLTPIIQSARATGLDLSQSSTAGASTAAFARFTYGFASAPARITAADSATAIGTDVVAKAIALETAPNSSAHRAFHAVRLKWHHTGVLTRVGYTLNHHFGSSRRLNISIVPLLIVFAALVGDKIAGVLA